MATNKIDEAWTLSREAAADLSDKVNYLARIDSDGKIALANSSTPPLGPIHEPAPLGGMATVYFGAIGKAIAGGSITAGTQVSADDNGKLVASGTGKIVLGIALSAGDAGDIVSYACVPGYKA